MIKNNHDIYFNASTSCSKVLFKEIVERVSQSGESGELPYIEFEDIISGEGKLNKDIFQRSTKKVGKRFNPDDVLFGKLRPYLRNIFFADTTGIAVGDFWVLRPTGIDPYLLYLLVNSQTFMKVANISSGSKMPRADWELVSNMEIVIPDSRQSQQSISEFFKSIDSYIVGVSNKLASLKQIKSACLQSMFPQEGESVPKVRFKGFNEEWKKDKLSKFVSRITRKNKNLESNLPLTISATDGLISQLQYFNNIVASANLSGYYLIKNGEFAYNKSYSNGYPFGSIKRLDKYDMGALSTLYIIFGIKDNSFGIDSDYLTTFFSTTLWHHEVAERAEEGARNHGLLNIGADDFLDINIIYPKDLAEQQQIATYFKNLDQQISLQTQRLEKLKQIKSACLDKMFV